MTMQKREKKIFAINISKDVLEKYKEMCRAKHMTISGMTEGLIDDELYRYEELQKKLKLKRAEILHAPTDAGAIEAEKIKSFE
jgi:hypothetical protein